jgi:hypothetical protein
MGSLGIGWGMKIANILFFIKSNIRFLLSILIQPLNQVELGLKTTFFPKTKDLEKDAIARYFISLYL